MDMRPPNCNYETFTIHTSSLGATSNTTFTSTFTRPLKDVVEASIIAASIRRADTVTFPISSTLVASATSATITHPVLSRPLGNGESLRVSGHTGTAQDLALNQTYTVVAVGSTSTTTVLTGTLMTASATPYTTGSVFASTSRPPALTSNVAYIRAEELETDFTDFAAAGQPATADSASSYNFPTGSNMLRRCFGAIYYKDNDSKRFQYKDRYQMINEYINPLHRLEKLKITIYDANGFQLDDPTEDGITYLTFRFVCKRKNLC